MQISSWPDEVDQAYRHKNNSDDMIDIKLNIIRPKQEKH